MSFGKQNSGGKKKSQLQKGKEYILKEFEDKSKVCYALKEEIKGLCFGAIGFKSSKRELLNIKKQRDAAI